MIIKYWIQRGANIQEHILKRCIYYTTLSRNKSAFNTLTLYKNGAYISGQIGIPVYTIKYIKSPYDIRVFIYLSINSSSCKKKKKKTILGIDVGYLLRRWNCWRKITVTELKSRQGLGFGSTGRPGDRGRARAGPDGRGNANNWTKQKQHRSQQSKKKL